MKKMIYEWLMEEIRKPFTKDRAEAVFYVFYLLYHSGFEAPEWEAIVKYLGCGDFETEQQILICLTVNKGGK